MANNVIPVGILGVGYWGSRLFARLRHRPDFTVVSVCDPDPSRIAALPQDGRAWTAYSDPEAACRDPAVRAVVIATPFPTHYSLAKRALELGKHVLVEKPLAGSVVEADDLAIRARDAGRTLLADYTYIYDPLISWLGKTVGSHDFGKISRVRSVRHNTGIFRTDIDALWDLGAHDCAIARWLFGLPRAVAVTGATRSGGIVSSAGIFFDYGDWTFEASVDWNAARRERTIVAESGRRHRAEVDGDAGTTTLDGVDRPHGHREALAGLFDDFAAKITAGVGGNTALYRDVSVMLDAIDRSRSSGDSVRVGPSTG
jgi:predicted dehydrogenase